MYTAIQARNIATERANHRFYQLYRQEVGRIMPAIVKAANHGDRRISIYALADSRITSGVYQQIGSELKEYGYECHTGTEKDKRGHIKRYIEISW